jgi:hypothetical protein
MNRFEKWGLKSLSLAFRSASAEIRERVCPRSSVPVTLCRVYSGISSKDVCFCPTINCTVIELTVAISKDRGRRWYSSWRRERGLCFWAYGFMYVNFSVSQSRDVENQWLSP